jgi:hypothetical protein
MICKQRFFGITSFMTLLFFLAKPGSAAMTIEKIEYHGWKKVYRITNGTVELLVLADVGPRILHYGFAGKRNEFHEFAEEAGKTGGKEFRSYGGHRLLVSPEVERTYYPDNVEVEVRIAGHTLLLTAPDNLIAHSVLWTTFSLKGMYKEALASTKAYLDGSYGDRNVEEALDRGNAESGYPGAMRRAAEALTTHFHKAYVNPADIAILYVEAGERAQALTWLEKGIEVHDPSMPYLGMPNYDSLRSNPRFQELLRRMNLPP